jgi:integral membrane protein
MTRARSESRDSRTATLGVAVCLRAFQVVAIAEGGLLPAILLTAVVHWTTGRGATLVEVIGATHGTVFTAYVLLVAPVAVLLGWPLRTVSVAVSVAFIPFATWVFERRTRAEINRRIAVSHAAGSPDRRDLVHDDPSDHGRPEHDDQQEGPAASP